MSSGIACIDCLRATFQKQSWEGRGDDMKNWTRCLAPVPVGQKFVFFSPLALRDCQSYVDCGEAESAKRRAAYLGKK